MSAMGAWKRHEETVRRNGRRRRARAVFRERVRRARMRRLRLCAAAMACAMVLTGLTGLTGLVCPTRPAGSVPLIAACRAMAGEVVAVRGTGFGAAVGVDAANDADASRGCVAALEWPLRSVRVVEAFDGPARPWLSGHRGVDLAAVEGDELLAPADATVSFAGTVAGKQVVSLRHDALTLTFEPAVASRGVGARVRRGDAFAEVGERSDHCDGACVHWGVRRADDYLDPEPMTVKRRIALKSMEDDP